MEINGDQVEVVQEHKYLGTILDSKLDWSFNCTAILKKGHQRLYFLRKLRSFGVQPAILMLFYQATVESILTYNSLCYFGNLRAGDSSRLQKLTRTASSVNGRPVTDLQAHHDRKVLKRIQGILADQSHPLLSMLATQRATRGTSKRLRSLKSRTCRFHQSFVPAAIRLYNQREA